MFQLSLVCIHEAITLKYTTVVSHACCLSYPPKNAKVLCEFLTADKNVRREKNKLVKFDKNRGNLKLYKDLIVRGFIKIPPPPHTHTHTHKSSLTVHWHFSVVLHLFACYFVVICKIETEEFGEGRYTKYRFLETIYLPGSKWWQARKKLINNTT